MEPKLKYIGYAVTFQEVPNEVSLVINISGCPHRCEGCHSDYLWKYEGDYLLDDLYSLLERYSPYITCVCFMGGDQNYRDLQFACDMVRNYRLKTCIYSGLSVSIHSRDYLEQFAPTYYKVGNYDKSCGGLDSPSTNQRFYKRKEDGTYQDITPVFWRNHHESNGNTK